MFGLSFLSPAFLLGALVAAVPIALHLLGRRPHLQVPFAAVRLLTRMPADQTRRRRLRDLLLLALRVAALVLLAVAFARPYLAHAARSQTPAAVVVAIDRSFSMSAPGQAGRARAAARAAAAEAPAGTPVGVVAFDDEAVAVLKPTTDRAAVRQAIDRVQVGYGGTSYGAALARAADLFASAAGRIVVVTDLQRTGWNQVRAAIPAQIEVKIRDVGGVASNLAVSDLRRGDDGVSVMVRNSGQASRTGRLRLNVAGAAQATLPFALAGGAVQRMVFAAPGAKSGEMSAELDDAPGYQADNRTFGLLDPAEAPTLLVVTSRGDSRAAFYLRQALEVEDGRFFRTQVVDAASFPRTDAASLDRYGGAIVLGTRGLDAGAAAALRDYAAAGNGMLIALGEGVEGPALDALLGVAAGLRFDGPSRPATFGVLEADSRHPLLQPLGPDGLGGARFQRIAHTAIAGQDVIARFPDGTPALAEIRKDRGRVLVFASDLGNRWNDLPLQPAFLPLVHELARYLVGGRFAAREFTVTHVPAGVPREPGVRLLAGASAPGLAAAGRRRVVVNVDAAESDVSRMTMAEFQAAIERRAGGQGSAPADPLQSAEQQRMWRLAIAFAIVALLVESMVGKKVTT